MAAQAQHRRCVKKIFVLGLTVHHFRRDLPQSLFETYCRDEIRDCRSPFLMCHAEAGPKAPNGS